MLVWDNQQETSWFIGILEGEGSCGIYSKNRSSITIVNTENSIIETCANFLIKRGFSPTRFEYQPKAKKNKRITQLRISGRNECNTLIKTLGDSFQCRKQEFLDKLNLGSSTTTRDTFLTNDLHWLVGIFEAEGSLGLNIDHNNYYYPQIGLKNTNHKIIEKIAKTLHSLGLSWYTEECKDIKSTHKRKWQVRIRGILRCNRFLYKMKNLWRSVKYPKRANLIEEFLIERLSKNQKEPYSERQHQIYQILRMKI